MPTTPLESPENTLFTEPQAAHFLGVAHTTLRLYRYRKQGPQYSRLGTWKGVRYRLSDLQAWLTSREAK